MRCSHCGYESDSENSVIHVNDELVCEMCIQMEAEVASAKQILYICPDCAYDMGWTWPEDHTASAYFGRCDSCDDMVVLTKWTDWNQ